MVSTMALLGTKPPHSSTWEASNAWHNWKPTGVGGWAKLKTILVFRAPVDGDRFVVGLHWMHYDGGGVVIGAAL